MAQQKDVRDEMRKWVRTRLIWEWLLTITIAAMAMTLTLLIMKCV